MLKPWRQRREVWTPSRRFRLVLILCVWNCGMPGFLAISMRHLHDEQIQWLIINAISMVIHGLWLISGFRGSPTESTDQVAQVQTILAKLKKVSDYPTKTWSWISSEQAKPCTYIYIYTYMCMYIYRHTWYIIAIVVIIAMLVNHCCW